MSGFVSSVHGLSLKKKTSVASHSRFTMSTAPAIATQPKITLFSIPVSNYAARVRYLIKRKQLPEEIIQISEPATMADLKKDDYLKFNPLGKLPTALIRGDSGKEDQYLYESAVICEYMAENYDSEKPSFIPDTPGARARARLIAHLIDKYVCPFHHSMYKDIPGIRAERVENMKKGFDAIEHTLDDDGPYAAGKKLSIADCCLWGNWPFYDFMLPTFFGWSPTDGRPKLKAWVDFMRTESPAAREVYVEVFNCLDSWWENDRWVKLGMTPLTSRPEMPF